MVDFKNWCDDKYFETELGYIINGDCLIEMKKIPDNSVDMILCDLPYGKTECKWDAIIPFDKLWSHYNRIIKNNGAIVLFSTQPFATALINSNIEMFKFECIWIKTRPTGFGNANHRPMRKHENILVFSKAGASSNSNPSMIYNPQGLIEKKRKIKRTSRGFQGERQNQVDEYISKYTNYPTTILEFSSISKTVHPTQKPLDLCEYLIKTYSNKGDLVLDNTAGVMTTGLACENLHRRWICIEKDKKYCELGKNRFIEK